MSRNFYLQVCNERYWMHYLRVMVAFYGVIEGNGYNTQELYSKWDLHIQDSMKNVNALAVLLGWNTSDIVHFISTSRSVKFDLYQVRGIKLRRGEWEQLGSLKALTLALDAAAASAAEGAATVQVSGGPQEVQESAGSLDMLVAIALVTIFCISKLLTPMAMSRAMFDRASPIHVWKYQPLMVAAPAFFYDVLSLNSYISKYQICILLLLAAMNAVYRADMWNAFKRKYLLLQTQDLHYQAPSTVRQLQRKTLLQFLEKTSTDDYANMLLETSIGHGTNIRELARDMSVSVWDPSPSSTAAWKLAFSLVTKSLRRQKLLRKQKMDTKQEVHRFIEHIVHEMVDTAVDTAAGHGARMKLAGSLAQVTAKRRAVRRLRQHALNRRTLRAQRRAGQLSATAAHLSTASGTLRSVQDLKRDVGPMRPLLGAGSDMTPFFVKQNLGNYP
eukprot:s1707_g1.t2